MSRVKRSEPEALNAFFDTFFPRVYGYVANTLRDRYLAEDLTQEAFIRIHKNIDKLDPKRDPAPWVFTIVSNILRDFWRSREHKMSTREVDLEVVREKKSSGSPDPELSLERRESEEAIREALEHLSPNDREVILLRDYEGLGTSEIAGILSISQDAVRQRHSRAVGRLGEEYRRMGAPDREG